jgi:mRNA-degrading endonuclease toxin of MazEF toxin-antitoxin module
MQPKHGDIVLIPIPFTDLSSQKQRPVVVISNDNYNYTTPDFVVVAMTSNPTLGPYSLRSPQTIWRRGSSTVQGSSASIKSTPSINS